MPAISLRLDLRPGGRIGPGKVALLENIASLGSISAGARAMNMSYKRAWLLVEDMNRLFGAPVIAAQKGGQKGGGAELTGIGLAVVARYRAIERAAEAAAAPHLAALRDQIVAEGAGGDSDPALPGDRVEMPIVPEAGARVGSGPRIRGGME